MNDRPTQAIFLCVLTKSERRETRGKLLLSIFRGLCLVELEMEGNVLHAERAMEMKCFTLPLFGASQQTLGNLRLLRVMNCPECNESD